MSVTRKLLVALRTVEPAERDLYDAAWLRYRDVAQAGGAKAWRFRATATEERFIEFLEYPADRDPRSSADLKAAGARLESLGPSESEEWTDANPT